MDIKLTILLIWIISFAIVISFARWSYKKENFVVTGTERKIAEENYVLGLLTLLPIANTIIAMMIVLTWITHIISEWRNRNERTN